MNNRDSATESSRLSRPETKSGIARDRLLTVLLIASLVGAIVQITMGGAVRVTGSGDGCPDWPTCFGSWIPPFEFHALMEYSHRLIGSLLGLVVVASVARIWLRHRDETSVVVSATAGLAVVAIAGGIGGAVVLSELDPGLRTLHLTLAESVAAILAFALVSSLFYSQPEGRVKISSATVAITWIAAVVTLAALLSGSYAVWRGVGAVCPSWPLCGGPILPESQWVWIHMAHRILAFAAAVSALWAGHAAMRIEMPSVTGARVIRIVGLAVVVLVVIQVLLGAANPWTDFAEWAKVSHLTFATLQWTALILLGLLLNKPYARRVDNENRLSDAISSENLVG